MIGLLVGIVLLVVAIVLLFVKPVSINGRPSNPKLFSIAFILGAIVSVGISCVYTQDIGEAVVLKSIGGSIDGQSTEAGFHLKAPWQTAMSWDIRNRQINFYGDSAYSYSDGSYEGAEVTINDKTGTSADVDIQVIYSIDADSVSDLYKEYGSQEAFVTNYVSNDVRATAREVSGKFDTITMLTDRGQYAEAITSALEKSWEDKGVIVEQVQVQAVVYDDSITSAYAEAQTTEVAKQKAINEQETAKIQGETKKIEAQAEADAKVIEAQGEADANDILNKSLTDKVLQQRYIEALENIGKSGNMVLIPEGSTPIINTVKGATE